jgi:hypothetical protein
MKSFHNKQLYKIKDGNMGSSFIKDMKHFSAGYKSLTQYRLSKINKVIDIILFIDKDINANIKFYYTDIYDTVYVKLLLGRVYAMLKTKLHYDKKLRKFVKDMQINFVSYHNPRYINKEYKQDVDEMNNIIAESGQFNSANGMMYASIPLLLYITRNNDMMGLTVHEMGHIIGCDGRIIQNNRYINTQVNLSDLKNKLNIAPNHGLDDEYTEGLNSANSSVLHSLFNAIEFNMNENEVYDTYELYKKFVYIETMHSLLQTVKLLRWYRMYKIEDFFKHSGVYKQKGLMFEYIFMRAYTLLNYQKYMNIIFDEGNIFKPYTKDPYNKQQRVIDDIIKHVVNGTYNNIFNIIFDIHNNNIDKNKTDINNGYIMEYYATDMRYPMRGGTNYYHKYLKYYNKYMKLLTKENF